MPGIASTSSKEETKKSQSEPSSEDIRGRIKQFRESHHLQKNFDEVFKIICGDSASFSNDFHLEYHIVVFNPTEKKRFTILQTQKIVRVRKEDDSKPNNFGIVGKLFSQCVSSDFLMVQFGYGVVVPRIYVLDKDSSEIVELKNEEFDFVVENENFSWATSGKPTTGDQEERKYAIAAMLFSFGSKKIGAISLDFVTREKKYPNFAFRLGEIEQIYHMMRNLKVFIEMMLTSDIHTELREIVGIARGGIGQDANQ